MKKMSPAVAAVMGCIAFMNVARNQRFEAFHNVDVLGLVAAGACFGVALVSIVFALRTARPR
jgi:hypothetical protein